MLSPWLQPRSIAHPGTVGSGWHEGARPGLGGPTGRWTARMQPHLPLGRARSARGPAAARPTPFRRPTPFPRPSSEEITPATAEDALVADPAEPGLEADDAALAEELAAL